MRTYDKLMTDKFGSRYTEYRDAYNNNSLAVKLEFPLEIDLDLRDSCNLKCPACHSIGRTRSNSIMPEDTLDAIVDECGQYMLPAVNIGGCGEPLIDADYAVKCVSKFSGAGVMDIFLHTNAMFLTEQVSEKLINAGLTYLCVSIDAAKNETYQKMRGADLERLKENVNAFLKVRGDRSLPALRVSFLPTEINGGEADEFRDYWEGRADYVDFQFYYTNYETQPKQYEAATKPKSSYYRKRISIVAPEYLCRSCKGVSVTNAIDKGNTLTNHGSIKHFWDTLY